MKLKKAMILFGTVCMFNIMVAGCGSGSESAAKTEGNQTGEALQEEQNDVPLEETDGNTEELSWYYVYIGAAGVWYGIHAASKYMCVD